MRKRDEEKSGGKKIMTIVILIIIIAVIGVLYFNKKSENLENVVVESNEPVVEKELTIYDEVTNYKTSFKYMSNSGFNVTDEVKEEDSFPIVIFENTDLNIKMEMQYCLTTDEDFETEKESAKKLDDFKEYNINGYTGYGSTNDGVMFVYIKLLGNGQEEYIKENTEENENSVDVNNVVEETNIEEETTNKFVSENGVMLKIFIERCNTEMSTDVYDVFNSEDVQNILNTMIFSK